MKRVTRYAMRLMLAVVAAITATRVFAFARFPKALTYDGDGNMTSDGRFTYTWNAENRMVCASNAEVCVTYAYDHRGRMVTKQIMRSGSAPVRIEYLWDGWNIIRETQVSSLGSRVSSPVSNVTYNVWGLDLDGTMQGAGGVGGLLAVVRDGETYLPTYDANGNVSEYVSAADGTIAAHYDYSPFGEPLVSSGPLASTFTHRFSTKPWCANTGLVEYQLRKYRPGIGRWMNRDPIGEKMSFNRMSYVVNNSCNRYDILGLFSKEIAKNKIVTIHVQDCEIVVLDGHGHKSIPHNFVFPDEGCSGGAFRCCETVTVTFTSTIKPLPWYDILSEPPRKDTIYISNCTEKSFVRQPGGQDNYPIPETN